MISAAEPEKEEEEGREEGPTQEVSVLHLPQHCPSARARCCPAQARGPAGGDPDHVPVPGRLSERSSRREKGGQKDGKTDRQTLRAEPREWGRRGGRAWRSACSDTGPGGRGARGRGHSGGQGRHGECQ